MRQAPDGGLVVTDGPYAETVEQLTGFYLVESDDLDDLVDVCGILAATGDTVEVRPFAASEAVAVSRHLLLLPAPEAEWALLPPEEHEKGMRSHEQFHRDLAAGGHRLLAAGPLTPSAQALSMRPDGSGGVLVTDGPFTESVEQMVGFYLVETADRADLVRIVRGVRGARRADRVPRHGRRRRPRPRGRRADAVKRYVILIAYRPWDWSSATPEVRQSYVDAHDAFQHYVDEHGSHLGSAALGDADTATTLRTAADGSRTVTDGPFAELAEQIGGYYDVELPDLDSAIAAARLLPPAYTVEIRPVIRIEGYDPQ